MECSVLAAGQRLMRPSSQASWASTQLCGVPSTRMNLKSSTVLSGKGEISGGPPRVGPLAWVQQVLRVRLAVSGTGIGNRSPKPRTPLKRPEIVIEGPVLLHEDDDVLDVGQGPAADVGVDAQRPGDRRPRQGGGGCAENNVAAIDVHRGGPG